MVLEKGDKKGKKEKRSSVLLRTSGKPSLREGKRGGKMGGKRESKGGVFGTAGSCSQWKRKEKENEKKKVGKRISWLTLSQFCK